MPRRRRRVAKKVYRYKLDDEVGLSGELLLPGVGLPVGGGCDDTEDMMFVRSQRGRSEAGVVNELYGASSRWILERERGKGDCVGWEQQ